MALKIKYKIKSQGVTWKCGHMYNFKYSAAENDMNPDFLFLYAFSGYHPSSKREWRFMQGITLSYLPRKVRKQFINDWKKEFGKGKNFQITWKNLTRKYPYLKEYTRRYFYSPKYYIKSVTYIPPEEWEKQIVKSWAKDFSGTIRRKIASKLKRMFTGGRR